MSGSLMRRVFAASVFAAAAASAFPATTAFDIRAATYNIRLDTSESNSENNWGNRKSALVSLVRDIAPDVIGFQEVKPSQYDYLKAQMSDYAFVGVKRDTGSSAEATPVAYRTSRFKLLESATFWLSATPETVGSKTWGNGVEDSGLPRICTWVLLQDRQSMGVFCFANTHLDLKAGPRLEGVKLILSRLGRFLSSGVPVLLTGDMNEQEANPAMVFAAGVLQDAFLASETTPSGPWRTFNGFNWIDPDVETTAEAAVLQYPQASARAANTGTIGKRIDFIFTSKSAQVRAFATRNDPKTGKRYYPSDHYPVVADLTLTETTGKVRIVVTKSCPSVLKDTRFVLTEGANLVDDSNLEFDLPSWVKRAAVEDGEIVIYTKPKALAIHLR